MAEPGFVHLHVHTHYSLLDGACKIGTLIKQTKALGMDSLAITDHGVMFGVIEFFNECKKEGIKPILGMEAYVAPGPRTERSTVGGQGGEYAYHLVLLAENLQGYKNLLKLASTAFLDGFYYKPRIDKDVLREHKNGLIATSACLGGEIPSALIRRDTKAALQVAQTYAQIFGPDRFFVEIQKQGIKEQDEINPELVQIARKVGCGIVGTNDVHFLKRDDHYAHDVLCCISMGRLITDESRLKYPTELYLKGPQEMAEAFAPWPEAMANTVRIASMCSLELEFGKKFAPVYKVPPEKLRDMASGTSLNDARPSDAPHADATPIKDDERYLRQLCEDGLVWRYGTRQVTAEVRQRLEKELKVIVAKSFCSYFLIVWDFCNYARSNGIPVGARGSGVGTMVGYLLGLCDVDPIRYGLLFERFMDPSRNEMPDIDIDICQDGRQKVIEYVRQKYGHVAQIVSFNTLAARAACKDVGRVLGVPLPEIDRLTKLIPGTPGMTLDKALASVPDLEKLYQENPTITKVIDIARRLEGMCRNTGIHAAGVIIADQPIENIAPLYKSGDDILTQFEGPIAEKVGLLKMDFLGLKTLSIITRAVKLVKQTRNVDLDIEKIDITDKTVLDLFGRGETRGVFQFESGGMQDLLMKMQPDRIEDLIAANALYRPGPMELIPSYCARKHGKEPVPQVHPLMDKLLEETYGVMTYQEQVMQIFNQLGGIELANAYKLIKAISKKQVDVIAKFKPEFIKGATSQGVSREKTDEIFEHILKFGGYGFNKCVVAKTVLIDAASGERTTVGSLFNDRRPFMVHALGEDGKLRARRVTDVMSNGRRLVFEVRTAQGRRITATANHPFRVLFGWRMLADLRAGDAIAAPRHLRVDAKEHWPAHEIITLAGLLTRGNTTQRGPLHFYCSDRRVVNDFAQSIARFPDTVVRIDKRKQGYLEVTATTGRRGFYKGQRWNRRRASDAALALAEPALPPSYSGAFRWAQNLGLFGCKATTKFMPDAVFRLCDPDLELLLGRMWAGDGFLANEKLSTPSYSTHSPQLAADVHTLLLRLGIMSGIHTKIFTCCGKKFPGYEVCLLGKSAVETFAQRIGPHCLGWERELKMLLGRLDSAFRNRSPKDTLPGEISTWIDEERQQAGLTWRQLAQQSQVSVNRASGQGCKSKLGFCRSTIVALADLFSSRRLHDAATSDVFWDRVVAIEPKGLQDTYDLTVEEDHNFVADGLIVHNSHSTRYAFIAFQTAYLKAYYPVEYMAALLTYEMGSTEKVVEYIDECRRLTLPDGTRGIKVLPPDVNISDKDFTPAHTTETSNGKRKKSQPTTVGVIRFGLCAVRGVGEKAVEAIITERQAHGGFANLYDFCERVDMRQVTRSTIEALIKCGGFTCLKARRAQLLHILEPAIEMGQQAQADKRNGQLNMFGAANVQTPKTPAIGDALPDIEEIPNAELLKYEKELLGFYITSHPLTDHQSALERYTTASTREALGCSEGTELTIGGMISRVKKTITKNGRSAGQHMAMITLEDLEGQIDGVIFAENFAEVNQRYPGAVVNESIVFMKGKVDKRRETPSIIVSEVIPVEDALTRLTTALVLKLETVHCSAEELGRIKPLLQEHHGNVPVFLQVPCNAQQTVTVRTGNEFSVKIEQRLLQDLEMILGSGNVQLYGAGSKRQKRIQQQEMFQEQPAGEPEANTAEDQAMAVMDAEAGD